MIKHKFLIPLIALVVFQTSCDKDDNQEDVRIEGSHFSLQLTNDWEHIQGQGFDSYVGTFTNGIEAISYDYGHFAAVNLDAIHQTAEMSYYEETFIDGAPAKIIKMNVEGISRLTLFIEKDDSDSGMLWIDDPGSDQYYIAVFKTFQFL